MRTHTLSSRKGVLAGKQDQKCRRSSHRALYRFSSSFWTVCGTSSTTTNTIFRDLLHAPSISPFFIPFKIGFNVAQWYCLHLMSRKSNGLKLWCWRTKKPFLTVYSDLPWPRRLQTSWKWAANYSVEIFNYCEDHLVKEWALCHFWVVVYQKLNTK